MTGALACPEPYNQLVALAAMLALFIGCYAVPVIRALWPSADWWRSMMRRMT